MLVLYANRIPYIEAPCILQGYIYKRIGNFIQYKLQQKYDSVLINHIAIVKAAKANFDVLVVGKATERLKKTLTSKP